MIIVKLVGGLASQLHKYAVGRALAIKRNTELKLDISQLQNPPEIDTSWEYELNNFNINAEVASESEINRIKPNYFLLRLRNKLHQYFGVRIAMRHYVDDSNISLKDFFNTPDNSYLYAEWGGYKYFESIKNILVEEIQSKDKILENSKYLKLIQENIVVSLHVRRGDYVNNKLTAQYHETCGVEYFSKSVEYMKKAIDGDFVLLIFSDDLDWVKQNLYFADVESYYVDEAKSNIEEFMLMTKCHHNIISSSFFSWFSSWLGDYENKIVIAPKYWIKDKKENDNLLNKINDGKMVFMDIK